MFMERRLRVSRCFRCWEQQIQVSSLFFGAFSSVEDLGINLILYRFIFLNWVKDQEGKLFRVLLGFDLIKGYIFIVFEWKLEERIRVNQEKEVLVFLLNSERGLASRVWVGFQCFVGVFSSRLYDYVQCFSWSRRILEVEESFFVKVLRWEDIFEEMKRVRMVGV